MNYSTKLKRPNSKRKTNAIKKTTKGTGELKRAIKGQEIRNKRKKKPS